MDAILYLREKSRLTKDCGIFCVDCRLSTLQNEMRLTCTSFEMRHPEQAASIIEEWAKECPGRTFKDVLLEKFPNVLMYTNSDTPNACVKTLFGKVAIDCGRMACADCWNQPYVEEVK